MLAGALMAALFALVVLGFAANQVGSGLALTIFGLGLSGLIGAPFVGARRDPVAPIDIPGLSDIPVVGRLFFEQDLFVYASIALTIAGRHLSHPDPLRPDPALHRREPHLGPCARAAGLARALLGHPVRRRLRGPGGCLSRRSSIHASGRPGMTAGRGWIALALVVFAAWRPGWVLVGAYIFGAATVLQLHAQAAQFGVPSQLLSAVPYLATILALLLLSLRHGRAIGAPGSLGVPFVPDR